jgi:ATP-binding cassette subfamily C protein CydC
LPTALPALAGAKDAAARVFALADRLGMEEPEQAEALPDEAFVLHCRLPKVEGRLAEAVSLTLREGEAMALLGLSGSGKSSVVQWITRMMPLPKGAVLMRGDISAERMTAHTWRQQFAVLEQRPYLFCGTIRDNLLIASPHSDDASLLGICRIAHFPAGEFADGLDTAVGEHGATLSGGQQRRLALARTLLVDAPCLVLDEPTEGLDARLAQQVMADVLARAAAKRQAVLVISHQGELQRQFERRIVIGT